MCPTPLMPPHSFHGLNPNATVIRGAQFATRPVDEQDGEVDRLEVGQGRVQAAEETPGQGHDEVP